MYNYLSLFNQAVKQINRQTDVFIIIWPGKLAIWLSGYLAIWLSGYLAIWLGDRQIEIFKCSARDVQAPYAKKTGSTPAYID
jgi:hypothetical protein